MRFSANIRKCDDFGAPFQLHYSSDSRYRTIGGGILSVLIKITVGVFFVMRIIQLASYKDPTSISYEVREERFNMAEGLDLESHRAQFYFGFINDIDL